ASMAVTAPVAIILLMATLFSPEWSFPREQWDLYFRALGFALVWTVIVCSLVLAASSLASRRTFALLGVFGLVMLSTPIGGQLGHSVDHRWYAVGFLIDLDVLAQHMLGKLDPGSDLSVGAAWTAITALVIACWAVIWLRLKRLEVVA